MEYLAAIGWALTAGIGIFSSILWVRNSGLRSDVKQAKSNAEHFELALRLSGEEFAGYKKRSEDAKKALVGQLEHYENHELEEIENEPDRDRRIRKRRDWVRNVLSKT